MNYVIIEDEKIAAERLRNLVEQIRPYYRKVVTLDSVESACVSLPALKADLLFMDIQLADGLCFDIMDQVSIDTPVIFTTAYDQYAIQAFKANSVDYLLKPLVPKELEDAIEKFEKFRHQQETPEYTPLIKSMQPEGKERFVVKVGDHLKSIKTEDLLLVFSQDKATYLLENSGRRYLVDHSLEKMEDLLSPQDFFRISRKFIVQIEAIRDIIAYTNSRLEVKTDHFSDEQIIVARERVNEFKQWLDR
jgi:DNA-binding LytR/AlgR family response regulator